MEVHKLTQISREQAKDLHRKYQEHRHWSSPVDREIARAYDLIAKGRVVIQAMESIKAAGLDAQGHPKLALCRADAKTCHARVETDGGGWFSMDEWPRWNQTRRNIRIPVGTFKNVQKSTWHLKGVVPPCPLHLRPKRGIQNYHVLWEAEWSRVVPIDPYLLRRISGDLWLVVAAWDLTQVERAVLAGRLSS